MRHRLEGWLDSYPFVGDVRGKGLMLGVEIVSDKATRAGDHDLRDRIVDESFKNGLLLLGAGPSTIRFCPPLVLDEETADEGLAIMERVMDTL
jgi:4-aminobutyrate aminotransferase